MGDDLVWEEPPLIRGHRPKAAGKWTRVLEPMLKQPMRWARIAEGDSEQMRMLTSQLRRGLRETPPGSWSFVSRRISDDSHGAPVVGVYARYLGPDESES